MEAQIRYNIRSRTNLMTAMQTKATWKLYTASGRPYFLRATRGERRSKTTQIYEKKQTNKTKNKIKRGEIWT